MFFLFNITNPFRKIAQKYWKYGWYYDKKLTNHKFFEIQTFVDSEHILELEIDLRLTGRDHAGPSLEFVLGCLGVNIKIYDSRHWDYEKNDWECYTSIFD